MTMSKLEIYFCVWVDEKRLNCKLSIYVNVKLKGPAVKNFVATEVYKKKPFKHQ